MFRRDGFLDRPGWIPVSIQSWSARKRDGGDIAVGAGWERDVVFLNELRHWKPAALALRCPITKKNLPAATVVWGVIEGDDAMKTAVQSLIINFLQRGVLQT